MDAENVELLTNIEIRELMGEVNVPFVAALV